MAAIIDGHIKLHELKKVDQNKIIRGEKGTILPVTIYVNDESKFGNNCGITVKQSQEDRDAGQNRHYIGNGSVIWVTGHGDEGIVKKGERQSAGSNPMQAPFPTESQPAKQDDYNDLPF